jgi:hypothetical protein
VMRGIDAAEAERLGAMAARYQGLLARTCHDDLQQ